MQRLFMSSNVACKVGQNSKIQISEKAENKTVPRAALLHLIGKKGVKLRILRKMIRKYSKHVPLSTWK